MAYATAVEACVRHTDDATARLEAFCKRIKPLRAQVEAAAVALSTALPNADAVAGGAQYDASDAARRKQMGVYGARAVLGAACTCVSELAATSVGALGDLGALSLQARWMASLIASLMASRMASLMASLMASRSSSQTFISAPSLSA